MDNTNDDASLKASLRTGLCYDVRMRYHAKIVTNAYDYTDPHPEDPRRVYRIYKALAEAGLVSMKGASGADVISTRFMQHIPAREARFDEVSLVHDPAHWDFIQRTATMPQEQLVEATDNGDSIYFNNESFFCAKLSCGGVIDTCKAVVLGQVKNAIAVVRPPGHHAEPNKPGGFCLFNNVAVASSVMLRDFKDSVRKILILDWDIHHGNGTQRAFYRDPSVLYISLHRYDNGSFYPGGTFGSHDKCGEGPGLGKNVNIPWPCGGMGDGDYIYAFQRVVMPIANEFNPDLVILSSGFDAAPGDELGECFVSPAAYGHMTHMLKSLANGKLAVVLEGGYNLDSIATSALGVTKVLIGEAPIQLTNVYARPETVQTVEKVICAQAKYWKCMKIGHTIHDPAGAPAAERLHDIVRKYQAGQLFKSMGMTPLPIFREKISVSFEDQVLCTPGFQSAQTLVVFVHDPPSVWTEPDPVTGYISVHETYLLDGCLQYMNWVKNNGYGMIDINAPQHFTGMDDESYDVTSALQDLCLYVWDNYIDQADARNIVFISTGDACAGAVYLLGHREVRGRVKSSVSFVGVKDLAAIMPIMDEFIIDWYHKNSLVLTEKYHAVWDPATSGKTPRKKYGNVQQTDYESLNELMNGKFDDVIAFIEADIVEASDSSDDDGRARKRRKEGSE